MKAPKGQFGPTLWDELTAAGVSTLPFVVSANEITFGDSMTDADVAKVTAVINAHDPTKQQRQHVSTVTDTQFIQALAEDKYAIISWDEAYNWGGQGQLPQILITALDKISDTATRNRAYMKARSAKSYIYSDKWVQSILVLLPQEIVAKMPGTDAQDKLQQLFNFAATL